MPQRPPSLAERLRSAWAHTSRARRSSLSGAAARHPVSDKGSAFAERLRAAVSARH